ncbi:MAG: hypothetical protein MJ041_05435 [Acidaminococcaceae bacterium]|nr:hypothetical protein [Acidaminococcaceae bacterium]
MACNNCQWPIGKDFPPIGHTQKNFLASYLPGQVFASSCGRKNQTNPFGGELWSVLLQRRSGFWSFFANNLTARDIHLQHGQKRWFVYEIKSRISGKLRTFAASEAHLALGEKSIFAYASQVRKFSWQQCLILDLHIAGNKNRHIMDILGIKDATLEEQIVRMGIKAKCMTLHQMSCQFALYLLEQGKCHEQCTSNADSDNA